MCKFCLIWIDEQVVLWVEWLYICYWGVIKIVFDGFYVDDIYVDLFEISLFMWLVVVGGVQVIQLQDVVEIQGLVLKIEICIVEKVGYMILWDDFDGFIVVVSDFKIGKQKMDYMSFMEICFY